MTRFIASLSLALAGLVLFGQGAYIHAKALLAQVLLERAFSETIASGREVKPWSWADTWPVARIEVKRLHASAIVLAGSSGQALAFGPGHVELTPDAGERGVAVYSAHRDTHFRFLKDIAIGDEIDITRSDEAIQSSSLPSGLLRFAKKKQHVKALIFPSFFFAFQAALAMGCKVTSKPSLAIWFTNRFTLISGGRWSK